MTSAWLPASWISVTSSRRGAAPSSGSRGWGSRRRPLPPLVVEVLGQESGRRTGGKSEAGPRRRTPGSLLSGRYALTSAWPPASMTLEGGRRRCAFPSSGSRGGSTSTGRLGGYGASSGRQTTGGREDEQTSLVS